MSTQGPNGLNGSAHPQAESQPNHTIGDMMNIALAVDSGYDMPASVTLRSIAENVRGPILFYILDCGLTSNDKTKFGVSLSIRSDIALHFIDLPANSLASTLGPTWAKIDLLKCLQSVNRVLYLDADVLVRKDLRALWNTDLAGSPLAAAPDVWCTQKSQSLSRGEYFNCGVLLIDLVKALPRIGELESLCYKMKDSESSLHEQDPLNVHFKGEWVSLNLEWNAQGLGTYAKRADKQRIRAEEMMDPAIVHFTGPVHPSLAVAVNYHIQPFTAKPWGYAGAPGHPYGEEWWEMLEKTAWKGWRKTSEYKEVCQRAREEVLNSAKEEFNRRIEATMLS